MANAFRCRVITPEAAVLDNEVKYASVPLHDGLAGFMPGRAPVVAKLGIGELRLDYDDEGRTASRSFFVSKGFCRFENDELTLLAYATAAERLSEDNALAELRAAEARTVPSDAADAGVEMDKITLARETASAKLALARKATRDGI